MPGKQPAHLDMTGGKPPRQHMWEAIRRMRHGFAAYQVAQAVNQEEKTVLAYLRALKKAGYLETDDEKVGRYALWSLVNDCGAEYPRVNERGEPVAAGCGLDNLWRTLRILGELTAEDAATHASVGGVTLAAASAEIYLKVLAKAGYVQRIPGDPDRYRLLPSRYTGPRYPIYQKRQTVQVYDPNLDKVVWRNGTEGEPDDLEGLRSEARRVRRLLGELLPYAEAAPAKLLDKLRAEVQA